MRSAAAEAQRLRERRDAVEVRRSDALLALEAAEQQLAVAEDEPVDDEPDTEVRDAAAEALDAARSEEVEARLALRTVEERVRSGRRAGRVAAAAGGGGAAGPGPGRGRPPGPGALRDDRGTGHLGGGVRR